MSSRMDEIRAKFGALPFARQCQFLDGMDSLMQEAEAKLAYEVWVNGEKMPGSCTYNQLRTNFDALADGLEDDGDEMTIRIVAVYLGEKVGGFLPA